MAPRRERLFFRFFNLVEGEAEGRFAIGAVVFAALVVLLAWLWAAYGPRNCFCLSIAQANYLDPAREGLEVEHRGKGPDFLYRGTEKMGEMDFRCDGRICF